MCDSGEGNGSEFIRKVDKLAKSRELATRWDPSHGKGSHGRLILGTRITTIKDRKKELGKGLLNEMCKQLGITAEEIRNA